MNDKSNEPLFSKEDEALTRLRQQKDEELAKLDALVNESLNKNDNSNHLQKKSKKDSQDKDVLNDASKGDLEDEVFYQIKAKREAKLKSSLKRAKFTQTLIKAAKDTSLGISIVVAILLGVGLGLWLRYLTNLYWMIFVGVFIGVGAAIMNVYKAYKQLQRMYKDDEDIKKDEL